MGIFSKNQPQTDAGKKQSGGKKPGIRTRKFSYIAIDQAWVVYTLAGILLFLAFASFAFSYQALYDIGSKLNNQTWVGTLFPFIVDGFIIALAITILVFRSRKQRGREFLAWVVFAAYTVYSIVANGFHGAELVATQGGTTIEVFVYYVGAALAPFSLFIATHFLGDVMVEKATEATPEDAPAPAAQLVPQQLGALSEVTERRSVTRTQTRSATGQIDEVTTYLLEHIQTGADLPPSREIEDRFGVSKSTVDRSKRKANELAAA